jgi:hypothetical protein
VEARGLYHPFLGERAVRNDFRIDDRHFYIITGANMAGKSTFPASVGCELEFGPHRLPVCAETFRACRDSIGSAACAPPTTSRIAFLIFNAELMKVWEN